jgi:hypothetical protein
VFLAEDVLGRLRPVFSVKRLILLFFRHEPIFPETADIKK